VVWNIKSQSARLVKLIPSDTWGGAGLLGVTIRLDNYAGAEDRLIRVLTVEPNSPAAIAGLLADKDFLLGTTHQTLDSVDRLAINVLRNHINEIVELYVSLPAI
jgi:GRASP55/65 PDZ-like domain